MKFLVAAAVSALPVFFYLVDILDTYRPADDEVVGAARAVILGFGFGTPWFFLAVVETAAASIALLLAKTRLRKGFVFGIVGVFLIVSAISYSQFSGLENRFANRNSAQPR